MNTTNKHWVKPARIIAPTNSRIDQQIDRPSPRNLHPGTMTSTTSLKRQISISLIALGIFCGASVISQAKTFTLGSLFQDHMVLQRDQEVKVWGCGEPGLTVHVALDSQEVDAQVARDGRWSLTLPAHEAGGPYRLRATQGQASILCEDVLYGEVWICSGQSNMAFGRNWKSDVTDLVPLAKGLPLRSFKVKNTVSFSEQESCQGNWKCDGASSAVAFAFQYHLSREFPEVPIAIIQTSWGSSSIEGWSPLSLQDTLPHFKTEVETSRRDDRERVEEIIAGKKWTSKEDIFLRTRPNILYNAMMHPLVGYAARGFVWYQGEANSKSYAAMLQYGKSLPIWLTELRARWQNPEMHLLVVGLPGFGLVVKGPDGQKRQQGHPLATTWALFREQQAQVMRLPHTSVTNNVDLGLLRGIHPPDKEPVGRRLALAALHDVYARDCVASGPRVEKCVRDGTGFRLSYDHAQGLKTTDEKAPRGFWIEAANGGWHVAEARIDGQDVVVSCAAVADPQHVRYAYAGKPDVNLVNSAQLPAWPYRNDGR